MWEAAEVKGCSNILGAITSKETDWKEQILTLAPNTRGKKMPLFLLFINY